MGEHDPVAEGTRLHNPIGDRAARVDRVKDLLMTGRDSVPAGVQVAPDRDEVRLGAERLAEGGAVCAVPGSLEPLHDRLRSHGQVGGRLLVAGFLHRHPGPPSGCLTPVKLTRYELSLTGVKFEHESADSRRGSRADRGRGWRRTQHVRTRSRGRYLTPGALPAFSRP